MFAALNTILVKVDQNTKSVHCWINCHRTNADEKWRHGTVLIFSLLNKAINYGNDLTVSVGQSQVEWW